MDLKTTRFRGATNQLFSETEPIAKICNKQEQSFDPNKLLTFQELPSWLQDNSFILNHYRPPMSFLNCFYSIFRLHNETGNIWTHLLPAIGILSSLFYHIIFVDSSQFSQGLPEKIMHCVFFTGCFSCLGLSSLFHTVHIESKESLCCYVKLDYSGISLMMMGKVIPWLYYTYYCNKFWQITYISATFLFNGGVALSFLINKNNENETKQGYGGKKVKTGFVRVVTFFFMTVPVLVPIVHACFREGFIRMFIVGDFWAIVLMFVFYMLGAGMYAARVPERFAPGKFDLILHSHQIFHICVVLAAVFYYYCILTLQKSRREMDYLFSDSEQPCQILQ